MKKTMKINLGSKVSFVRYTKKMDVKIYLNEAVQLVVNDGEGVVTKYGYVPNNALIIPAEEGLQINDKMVFKDTVIYTKDYDGNVVCGEFKGYFPAGRSIILESYKEKNDLVAVCLDNLEKLQIGNNIGIDIEFESEIGGNK